METRKQFEKGFDVMRSFEVKPIIVTLPKVENPYSYNSLLKKYKASLTDDTIIFTEEEKATENYKTIDAYYKQFKDFTNNSTYAKKMLLTNDGWTHLYYEVRNNFPKGIYKTTDIIATLNKLYTKYGMKRKAKFKDLENSFNYTLHKVSERKVEVL